MCEGFDGFCFVMITVGSTRGLNGDMHACPVVKIRRTLKMCSAVIIWVWPVQIPHMTVTQGGWTYKLETKWDTWIFGMTVWCIRAVPTTSLIWLFFYSLKWRLTRCTSFLLQIEQIFIPPGMWFYSPSLLTCCSMGLGLDPSGLCGRNSSSAGPLVSSRSRRRDFVPGGCSQWRTVSWCSNTQLQMASEVKLRSLRGKIWQKKTHSTMPVQSLSIHPKL